MKEREHIKPHPHSRDVPCNSLKLELGVFCTPFMDETAASALVET
jgi:hypothetical protein